MHIFNDNISYEASTDTLSMDIDKMDAIDLEDAYQLLLFLKESSKKESTKETLSKLLEDIDDRLTKIMSENIVKKQSSVPSKVKDKKSKKNPDKTKVSVLGKTGGSEMKDYKAIILAADRMMDNGISLNDEQREVALDAIMGHMNHVMYDTEKDLLDRIRRNIDSKAKDKAMLVYDLFHDMLSILDETFFGFEALASLGYKPSHDIIEAEKADAWELQYRIFDDSNVIPWELIGLYSAFERSAFTPCEYNRKRKELMDKEVPEEL